MKKKINILPTRENHLGGGTLNKKDHSDGLKKFSKFKKQKKIIVSAIIVLILVVGGITLYRTFALYEEKKEFNVLRGRVPDFSTSSSDIKLAFTINGEKPNNDSRFPNQNSVYIGENVTCNGGVTAKWNNNLWALVNIENESANKIECTVDFVDSGVLNNNVEVGDYISYTPKPYSSGNNSSNCSSDTNCTYNGATINPTELNLWRVIRKNSDGVIEAVSENTTSYAMEFHYKDGYNSIINTLKTASTLYQTKNVTTTSRHMNYEDFILVQIALGTFVANLPGTETPGSYFVANIWEHYWCGTDGLCAVDWNSYYVNGTNGLHTANFGTTYVNSSSSYAYSVTAKLRPIVTFASNLNVTKSTIYNKNLWKIN